MPVTNLFIILCVISAAFGDDSNSTVHNEHDVLRRSSYHKRGIKPEPVCFKKRSYDLDSGLVLRQVDQVLKGQIDEKNYKQMTSVKKLKQSIKKVRFRVYRHQH
ncbi:uncharacterized protein [Choristoneura fumiferana]|uniref:uncharacterized protein n=1 Tax=Choristoneura fumiferana TaxID=7141 RepID=UPI003D153D51